MDVRMDIWTEKVRERWMDDEGRKGRLDDKLVTVGMSKL